MIHQQQRSVDCGGMERRCRIECLLFDLVERNRNNAQSHTVPCSTRGQTIDQQINGGVGEDSETERRKWSQVLWVAAPNCPAQGSTLPRVQGMARQLLSS